MLLVDTDCAKTSCSVGRSSSEVRSKQLRRKSVSVTHRHPFKKDIVLDSGWSTDRPRRRRREPLSVVLLLLLLLLLTLVRQAMNPVVATGTG